MSSHDAIRAAEFAFGVGTRGHRFMQARRPMASSLWSSPRRRRLPRRSDECQRNQCLCRAGALAGLRIAILSDAIGQEYAGWPWRFIRLVRIEPEAPRFRAPAAEARICRTRRLARMVAGRVRYARILSMCSTRLFPSTVAVEDTAKTAGPARSRDRTTAYIAGVVSSWRCDRRAIIDSTSPPADRCHLWSWARRDRQGALPTPRSRRSPSPPAPTWRSPT